MKPLSIIGIVLSFAGAVFGILVENLYATAWDYNCYCTIRDKESLSIAITLVSLYMLAFSIVVTVKSFKKRV